MVFLHRILGTFRHKVDRYIALTDFNRKKLIEIGLPENKISVKPNFIDGSPIEEPSADSHQQLAEMLQTSNLKPPASEATDNSSQRIEDEVLGSTDAQSAPYALFVGRLSSEKGCDVLIRAWATFISNYKPQTTDLKPEITPQLFIVGDGPERAALEYRTSDLCPPSSVHFMGLKPKNEVLSLMHNAQFLVLPSLCYEGFPMTIVEAYSETLPVVGSDLGGISSVIEHKENGLLFKPGDSKELCQCMQWAFNHEDELQRMGERNRETWETRYSADVNYEFLMEIYREVTPELNGSHAR
jgi:glycosyltransferase involved in cell wall biosynthesis